MHHRPKFNNYQSSLKFKPNDNYAIERIALCEIEIKKMGKPTADKILKYKENIKEGDKLKSLGKYEDAIKFYNTAITYYDDDGQATTKISACEFEIEKNKCPNLANAELIFDNETGKMSCNAYESNLNFRYNLLISIDNSFQSQSILTSFELGSNSDFGTNRDDKKRLKKVQDYTELFFRYQIVCKGNIIGWSNICGPLKYGCKANKECQLMKYQN